MNAAAYNAELFQTSVMHVPTKEEADRSWRTLANCDETMLRELRRQWGCIAIPSSGANSTSSIYGAVASMRSMGYQVEHAEALLDAGAAAFHAENWAELAVITARVYAALRQAPEDPPLSHVGGILRCSSKMVFLPAARSGSLPQKNSRWLVWATRRRNCRITV